MSGQKGINKKSTEASVGIVLGLEWSSRAMIFVYNGLSMILMGSVLSYWVGSVGGLVLTYSRKETKRRAGKLVRRRIGQAR